MYKVLLVDDENLLWDSLEIILSLNNIEVIGKANDGNAAIKILSNISKDCDIALVDLNMKGMGGITVLDQKVMERITSLMNHNLGIDWNNSADNTSCNFSGDMTKREKEICSLMAEGLTNRQIADRLYISEGTVKNLDSGKFSQVLHPK